ncbi:MAG: hypothetical protein ACKVS8_02340 [Phycisphaerales bacterium]
MSASVGQARLKDALKALHVRLEATRSQWSDAARSEWDAEYIAPLEAQVRKAMDAIGRLAEVAAHARRECE